MILVQRILFLKNVPLFSTMPPDTLAWVAEAADETSYPSGQTIFEKGSEGDSMYVIADGSVRIHDGDKTLASLPQGAFFRRIEYPRRRNTLGLGHGGNGLPFAGDPAGFVPPNPLETVRCDRESAEDSRPADPRTVYPIAATEK